ARPQSLFPCIPRPSISSWPSPMRTRSCRRRARGLSRSSVRDYSFTHSERRRRLLHLVAVLEAHDVVEAFATAADVDHLPLLQFRHDVTVLVHHDQREGAEGALFLAELELRRGKGTEHPAAAGAAR